MADLPEEMDQPPIALDNPPQGPESPVQKLAKLAKMHANALVQGGQLEGITPISEEDARKLSGEHLRSWIHDPEMKPEVVDYLKTGNIGPNLSKFTRSVKPTAEQAAAYKGVASGWDQWVFEPLLNVPVTLADIAVVKPVRGVLGLPAVDLKAKFKAGMRWFSEGGSPDVLYQQEEARKQQQEAEATGGQRITQAAGTVAGAALGFTRGAAGVILGRASTFGRWAAEAAGLGKLGQAAAAGAAGFGAYNAITAEGKEGQPPTIGEGLKETGLGLVTGPAFEIAGAAGKAFASSVLRSGGKEGNALKDMVLRWGQENATKLESVDAVDFQRQLIHDWIKDGAPGIGRFSGRRIAATGLQAMVESAGFSAIDAHFLQDFVAGVWSGDAERRKRAFETLAGNALGMAMLRAYGLKNVPAMQRSMSEPLPEYQEPQKPEEPQQPSGPSAAQKAAVADMGLRSQHTKVYGQKITPEARRLAQFGWTQAPGAEEPIQPEQKPVEAGGISGVPIPPEIGAVEVQKPIRYEIKDSPYYFDVVGDQVTPSPKMRGAMGLPETMLGQDFWPLLERASLQSALINKAMQPGTEVSVEGTYADGDKLRTSRFGEPLERDLRPDSKWKPVSEMPSRQPDDVGEPQRQAVRDLLQVARTRADLKPEDRALLGSTIGVLDTVAAEKDQSVGETMQAYPALQQIIQQGDPEHAGMAIKALAESLTVKHPTLAIGDMAKAVEAQKPVEQPQTESGFQLLEGTGKSIFDVPDDERQRFMAERRKEIAKQQAEMPRKNAIRNLDINIEGSARMGHTDIPASERKIAEDVLGKDFVDKYVAENLPVLTKRAQERREAEKSEFYKKAEGIGPSEAMSGIPIPKPVVEAGKSTVRGAGQMLKAAGEYYHKELIERAGKHAGPEVEELGRKASDAIKKMRQRMETQGQAYDIRRQKFAPQVTEKLEDPFGGRTTMMRAAIDVPVGEHFGFKAENLSPQSKQQIEMVRNLTKVPWRVAAEMELPFVNAPEAQRQGEGGKRMPNLMTPEMVQATTEMRGKAWDRLTQYMQDRYGKSPAETRQFFTEARQLLARDPSEFLRKIQGMPSRLSMPGGGEFHMFLDEPQPYAERLLQKSSNILGSRSVFRGGEYEEGEKEAEGGYEDTLGLPVPAKKLIDKLPTKEAQQAAVDMIRALHGVPIRKSIEIPFAPVGSDAWRVMQVANIGMSLLKTLHLTTAPVYNIFEQYADAKMFGGAHTVARVQGQMLHAVADGSIRDLHRELVSEGWMPDNKENHELEAETSLESFRNAVTKANQIIGKPMHISQDWAEMGRALAGRERLAAMEEGNGNRGDRIALTRLGFSYEDAKRIAEGGGTPEEYDRYRLNIVGALAGGKGLTGGQKSLAGHSRGFNRLIWFTNFFQARARLMETLVKNIREAPGAIEKLKATGDLAEVVSYHALAGVAGTALGTLLFKGIGGLVDAWREATQDPVSALGGYVVNGLVGGMGQPVKEMAAAALEPGSTMEHIGNAVTHAIGPAGEAVRFGQMLAAQFGQEVPGYANLGHAGIMGHYLMQAAPLARKLNDGMFGVGALAIFNETDPKLQRAISSIGRWERDNMPGGHELGAEEGKAFRDAMKGVVDRVMAGDTWNDDKLMDGIEAAIEAKIAQGEGYEKPIDSHKARIAIAGYLMNRRFLKTNLPTDKLDSRDAFLGEDNLAELQGFDETLKYLARRVMQR